MKPEHMHRTQTHAPDSYTREHSREVHQLMVDKGKFGKIKTSMGSDPTQRTDRMHTAIEVTLQDLIEMAKDRGIDPAGMKLTFTTASWEREATPLEIIEQDNYLKRQAERTEKWELETLERLSKKHGRV